MRTLLVAISVCCLAAGVQVASAADTPEADFIAFPTANGDLASATDWGDTPFPTESTHVKINKNGTYTLSADLSIGSVYAAINDIVFDFTDGYAAGYAPIDLAFINPASASSRLEIECSEWAERGPRDSRELVLFRGDRSLNTSGTPAWLAGLDLNLPANVTCFIRDNELVLKREVPGVRVILR